MAKLIEPRTLKGFRDYPPALMIPRERVLQTAREVYRSYGYAPIDTPALERCRGGAHRFVGREIEPDVLKLGSGGALVDRGDRGIRFGCTTAGNDHSATGGSELLADEVPNARVAAGDDEGLAGL